MLEEGLDKAYRACLATSHERYTLVQVLDGAGNVLVKNLDKLCDGAPVDGTVSATLTSRVARTLSLNVPETLFPFAEDDLLAPHGNILRCWRGIRLATGRRYRWPVFFGRIQRAVIVEGGICQLQASDRGKDVVDAQFVQPTSSVTSNTVGTEIRRLIRGGVPDAKFGVSDPTSVPVQPMTWQKDRGQALDELASAVNSFWYALADGRFVLRVYPWTVPGEPVVTYSDDDPSGTIMNSFPSRSREDVFNSTSVTGERLNGDPAVFALEQDNNPDSPTFVGSFGLKHKLVRLQTPASQQTVDNAARLHLRREAALVQAWSWAMVPDAALQLGDVVRVKARGTSVVQVVTAFNLPLADGPMRVAARSQVLPALEGMAG